MLPSLYCELTSSQASIHLLQHLVIQQGDSIQFEGIGFGFSIIITSFSTISSTKLCPLVSSRSYHKNAAYILQRVNALTLFCVIMSLNLTPWLLFNAIKSGCPVTSLSLGTSPAGSNHQCGELTPGTEPRLGPKLALSVLCMPNQLPSLTVSGHLFDCHSVGQQGAARRGF